MQFTRENIRKQVWHIFNGDYAEEDVLNLLRVSSDEEKKEINEEYQRLLLLNTPRQKITNILYYRLAVLHDIASRK